MANTGLIVGGVGIAALAAYAAFGKEKPRFADEPMPRPGPRSTGPTSMRLGPSSMRSSVVQGAPRPQPAPSVETREPASGRPTTHKRAFQIGPYQVSIQDGPYHYASPGETVEIGIFLRGSLINPKRIGLHKYAKFWEKGNNPVGVHVPIAAANQLLRDIERHAGYKAQPLKRKS
jgi:hypothetical protein